MSVPEPPEPKPLQPGDPLPPLDILTKLRGFILCRRGLTWDGLQRFITGSHYQLIPGEHTLSVNKVWTHYTAPEFFIGRCRPELWKGGPFVLFNENVVLGTSSLEFCKAIKTLLDEGQLQMLACGLMQHAIDPVTGLSYQQPEAPNIPGLHVTITPGD